MKASEIKEMRHRRDAAESQTISKEELFNLLLSARNRPARKSSADEADQKRYCPNQNDHS